jgi:hypothetical protein
MAKLPHPATADSRVKRPRRQCPVHDTFVIAAAVDVASKSTAPHLKTRGKPSLRRPKDRQNRYFLDSPYPLARASPLR